jgi:dimethylhistidine N-methyltransferase
MTETESDFESAFRTDVVRGMSQTEKSIPSKYFYDESGSQLFEQITDLDEYYLTRTELKLLEKTAPEIAALVGPQARIVEYGAGALVKIRILLDALEAPAAFVPIDVSEHFLQQQAAQLAAAYPSLAVSTVVGSFLDEELDAVIPAGDGLALGFFPGSTLGNLSDAQILSFLRMTRRQLGADGALLLGVDINHDPNTLIPAYDDSEGVTAKFNRNMLTHINRVVGADFNEGAFAHDVVWNADAHQIEIYLRSRVDQNVTIAGKEFSIAEGERIHTENSRKFTTRKISELAAATGWRIEKQWRSPADKIALFYLV